MVSFIHVETSNAHNGLTLSQELLIIGQKILTLFIVDVFLYIQNEKLRARQECERKQEAGQVSINDHSLS